MTPTQDSDAAPDQHQNGYAFEQRMRGDVCVVEASGEIDLLAAPALKERLIECLEQEAGSVVVDLTRVSFLDSSGLGAILSAFRRSNELGRKLGVAASARPILNVFTLTGLDNVLDIRASADEF